jgi:hypothetical protein
MENELCVCWVQNFFWQYFGKLYSSSCDDTGDEKNKNLT